MPAGHLHSPGLWRPSAERLVIADARTEVGYLEGDLIAGAYNPSAMITVFDSVFWHLWLADLFDGHGARAGLAALCEILERGPERFRRTLTWDLGSCTWDLRRPVAASWPSGAAPTSTSTGRAGRGSKRSSRASTL
jgi:hypothetical protein